MPLHETLYIPLSAGGYRLTRVCISLGTLPRIHRWTGMDGVRTLEGVRELQAR